MIQANSAFNLQKYEDAKEKYIEAKELKPDNLEVQNKIDLCNFYSRLAIAKNEDDGDNKITQLENLKYDYPSKSGQLDNLINEAKKHKQIRIPLTKVGNSHKIKAKINNVLSFDFILDTGADNVLVAPDVFVTFYKAGVITDADIIGKQHFSIADGSTVKGLKFYLREIQIGEIILNNVEASVIAGGDYDMLLGGSVFKKIGKITIDYNNAELIIEK
jgi:predicted aspartyl protease